MTTASFIREILKGKDLYRILMNDECEKHTLAGLVADLGGGAGKPSYLRFFRQAEKTHIESVDLAVQGARHVDLEKDALPYGSETVDMILALNVLEHIFNYNLLLSETARLLKKGGSLILVVPFLINYHPDPSDFWRYTKETLHKLLVEKGFSEVKISALGTGPFGAGFSQIEWMIPRFLKLLCVPLVLLGDRMVRSVKPEVTERFPLGYFVTARIGHPRQHHV